MDAIRLTQTAPPIQDRLLEARVREAAAGRRFNLHYQPLVSVTAGAVVGVEALLRWTGESGRMRPSRFLPVLEATGLLAGVDAWVLEEAADWVAGFDGISLHVNVPVAGIHPGYARSVLESLDRAGLSPHRLCLELTDTVSIPDPAGARAELDELTSHGVELFLDDFGRWTSMEDLKVFAVAGLKLDSSFVTGLGLVPEDDLIVATLVSLADDLDLRVVAKGVETEAQLQCLRELGCDVAQGYHLFPPEEPARLRPTLQPHPRGRLRDLQLVAGRRPLAS
jgi:diguanylate cyclase